MGECDTHPAALPCPGTCIPGARGSLQAPAVRAIVSLRSCSQELSPDNERALHTSFHQLIMEQSSLIEADLELQERSRGKALQPQPGQAGDSVCVQGHPSAWASCVTCQCRGQSIRRSLLMPWPVQSKAV